MPTPDATCDECGHEGFRADTPDGEIVQDGAIVGRVPYGETVLCDSPEDAGALLCEDCYDQLRGK